MKRRSLVGVVCLAIGLLLATQITSARYELKVNEAETRFSFSELAPEVSLALENGAAQPLAAAVRVELLDPDNVIKAAAERRVTLKSGRQKVLFTLPFDTRALSPDMESKILWYRLHYRIKSTPASDSQSEGFVSLSEITPDLFELNVTGSGIGRGGMRYQARVRAVHPLTRRPASGVAIRGAIKLEDDADNDTKLTSQTITDREGWAQLQFKLPANVTANDMELTVEGARGLLRVKADKSIQVIRQPYLIVSTDKSLYQPGQTVHARILILDQSKRAVPAKVVTIKIEDPDDTVLFNTDVTTSRFGIAAADWPIPERTRLGDYTLKFTTEDDDERDAWVKVSRYDLPNFTVNVKPDRPYYLPGQDATIVVNADYLFGQPVQRGHVRLVRETERSWNYKEQKYETVEGDKYEGDVEADGKFSARVDLTKDHAELRLEDYRRYQDLSYAAYFTDPTTNRTEQRRFNIRLTKEPIHIYVVRPENTYYDSPTLPLRFFLSTSYADGSPAQCNVSIAKKDGPVLANTRTNRYGVASIDQLKFSATGLEDADLDLNFTAHDKTGMVGHHIETYQLKDQPIIRVATNKALLAAGEPISASITSTEQESVVTVEVVRDWSVLHSQLLRLHHGRASIVIPYQPEYKDEITVAAFIARGEEETTVGSHTVLFPRNRDLKLNLQLADKSYKPGELAHVSFRALNPGGRSVESALGVVVLDKAVEERIRTDQEFGQRYGGFNNEFLDLLGYGDSIGPITRKSLDELDLSKPIPPELQLTADALLNQSSHYFPTVFSTDDYQTNPVTVFSSYTKAQLRPLAETLNYAYERTRVYPRDEQTLSTLLASAGVNLHSFPDPWGTNYRPKFLVDHTVDVFFLESAGPDKKFDSDDDFSVERMSWPYFRPIGEAMDAAVRDYHQRTGGFVRDFATLQQELRQRNVDLGTLRDRWGKPYSFQFDVDGATFVIRVTTTAPGEGPTEEFQLWRSSLDYFAEMRAKIDAALFLKFKATSHFPENEAELFAALRLAGIDLGLLRDPWNHPYYFTFARTSFYADRNKIESTPTVAGTLQQRIKVEPITRTVGSIRIRSGGADHLENTGDDFTVGEFSSIVAEQSVSDSQPQAPRQIATLSGSTGAISGTVVDWQGAAISGATVKAKRSGSANEYETKTDENGKYVLRNLPAGQYELRIDASGFRSAAFPEIYLRSSSLFEVNATLEVGAITETVTVTAGKAETLNATSASVSTTVKNSLRYVAPIAAAKQQLFTPRLREYFPETLFWNPELTTDKKGRAQLDFKLADNITTWKMSVIGSTADGEIGTAETEIRSFQPFFADLDPPRVLTEGDRISLPVVLRNYLDRKQTVGVDLQPAKWFSLLDGNHKQVEVPAGDSVKQTFVLQAIASVKNGKQRVTAIGSEMSDAIEKPVTVHPDGEEKADTTSDVFQSSSSLNIALPADVIANSAHVELKVYPNLLAHVWESVEGIMQRPYGCGEQTISSTYPSLLVLRYAKKEGPDPLTDKARRYVQDGYQRLLGYQGENGGFTYWGRGEPDVALTAYALRFLHDLSEVVPVDKSVLQNARVWLLKQQSDSGAWRAFNYWDHKEDPRRTAMLTAVVARSLALTEPTVAATTSNPGLARAINYLQARSEEIDEPYLVASYSLAASLGGDASRASKANERLQSLAHAESNGAYWSLETNTPFYGWGLAGRVETTALAVQALARGKYSDPQQQQKSNDLTTRGLLFLLRKKDPYGVWYSTQATINVLEAMLSLLSTTPANQPTDGASAVTMTVNGQPLTALQLPQGDRLVAPLTVDLTPFVKAGNNRVELSRPAGGPPASLQIVSHYYIPWSNNARTDSSRKQAGDSESIRLETSFDKKEVRVSEEITCHVKAERIGFRGYGMLLAEVGLPPGAEVDRASLETAMRGSDWSLSQYDVLPDRVVFYLWPRAGGSSFAFTFRPRLAMTAKSSASLIYDYYNPEARAVVAPGTFVVK